MDTLTLLVFALVYLGMVLGRIPPLALDRTGVALLGAIVLVAAGKLDVSHAAGAIDVPTMALLFGLMVVSAQLRLGGFYDHLTRRIAAATLSPRALLALLLAVAGLLSAVLANDIVCLAMAPVLVEGCSRRRLNPVPYLLGLACASNVGSAATLIGNPQNMLVGQVLHVPFGGYLLDGAVPAALGMVVVWGVIAWQFRGQWEQDSKLEVGEPAPFNPWQSSKGLFVVTVLMGVFLLTRIPREVAAMAAAGVLLMSRRMATRRMLAQVDWHLLVLFAGLFVVNHALAASGGLERGWNGLAGAGVDVSKPGWLFVVTVVLSNLVSNVPAVMLLLPHASSHPMGGSILALASTLAGNLLLVGSIANLIVVDQAGRLGIKIGWKQHALTGVPVTIGTLAVAWAWLLIRGM
ncbi:MAG: anion transporter [Deltaproteobacteria bacterium]|nr:anion transporter [Deltaproteobacteria bacterium]